MRLSEFADNEILKDEVSKLLEEGDKAQVADEIMGAVEQSRNSRTPKEDLCEVEEDEIEIEDEIEPTELDRANRYLDEQEEVIEEQDERAVKQNTTYMYGSCMGPKAVFDSIKERAVNATYSNNQTI